MAGREVKPLPEFTFPSTGMTVKIRRIPAMITSRIRSELLKKHQRDGRMPEPPMQDVDYGNKKVAMKNELHPHYVRAYSAWQGEFVTEVGETIMKYVFRNGVECEVDAEAVAAVKSEMAMLGTPIDDEDDKYVYLAYVCIGDDDEIEMLREAVFRGSVYTQEAVEEAIETFPSDVQGKEHLEV